MFSKNLIGFVALSILSVSEQVLGRERWLERDNKPVFLHPRRFGQEHPAVIDKLSSACAGQVCGVLAGSAISTLLAASGECTQQDKADEIIDAAQQFDDTTKQNMINLAIEFRQVEKNTPPDFSTNPPTLRNSVFCQKAPKNAELNGLVQAQDPSNDPNIFFDPALQKSVTKGSQANTEPFGGAASDSGSSDTASSTASDANLAVDPTASCDLSVVTVTVTPTETATEATGSCSLVTLTIAATDAATTSAAATTTTADAAASTTAASNTAAASNIGDFGSCSVPQIEFGVGFDNRKETSFQPVDKTSYNHGSAQAIGIITQFICDTLTNSCGADQTAKDTCATAAAAANAQTAKTGAQADAFNAVFGITTNFASVSAVDDQGNVITGTAAGSGSDTPASDATTTNAAASTTSQAAAAATTSASTSSGSSSSIGDFGSCSVPQIEFGVGFDNRKETSFQPVDKTSYNHGSAQAIGIITQFICDTLTNSCGADQTAKNTCATATAAANAQTAKTGAQADAFNAVFGITTNFASVAPVDDQGNVIAGTGSGASNSGSSDAASAAASVTTSSAAAAAATTTATQASGNAASGGNIQAFTGALGGVTAPAVTALGNGQFQVDGNSAFNSLQNALVRSCDVQHNKCANAANASGNKGDLTVAACGDQQTQCNTQAQQTAANAA
ncbi:hypothetical protein PNOK_0774200 [Pyrrhoderma noxium]|uniref:Uncharacterized protein n=1 Tax=Pyrrhoderma noxium TaxID=2282107 RepID=A0A286U962_9AGAM|nr:hypothetical protein PNOK_0774200 [Pyrrhoderma noxium]